MEAMKQFPDNAFDLAVVDPPYGIGADNFKNGAGASKDGGKLYSTAVKMKNRLNTGSGKLKNRLLNQSDCSWDSEPPQKEYFNELFRVSKNQIIWGGNYFDLPPTRGIIVWDKVQPWENFSQVE
jgi:site-specific DNA-methyltransferase (adenine-specific)